VKKREVNKNPSSVRLVNQGRNRDKETELSLPLNQDREGFLKSRDF
jgi:hypothetical protein